MADRETEIETAARIEDLIPAMRLCVLYLRDPEVSSSDKYAMTYWLRREIGYAVRRLGAGVPELQSMKKIQDIADHYLNP